MALSSMTGFARADGVAGAYTWAWELKSVNAKGLELRLRLPPGWDSIELPARGRASESLARGTVYANLSVNRAGVPPVVRVNESVLAAVLATIGDVAHRIDAAPPSLDGILALKGVIEVSEADESEEARGAAEAAILAGFGEALAGLARHAPARGRGAGTRALGPTGRDRGALAARRRLRRGADRRPIKARLAEQVALLLDASDRFDADRLHQEAILIASKADIREELDRLTAHVAQARRLVETGGVGRPPARFPRPGAQSRGQHPVRQVERRRAHQYRSRAQERWSSSSASRCRTWSEEWGIPRGRRARRSPGAALMLVLSSPSGAGKTTLSRKLLKPIPRSSCPSR